MQHENAKSHIMILLSEIVYSISNGFTIPLGYDLTHCSDGVGTNHALSRQMIVVACVST